MQFSLNNIRRGAAVLATAVMLASLSPNLGASAQTTPPASTAAALSEATITALQEALTKQGIAVKPTGVLNDETRAAIRRYQSQHHLPVTGEPDKATLDKLGVRVSAAQPGSATTAQAAPATPSTGGPSAQGPASPPAPTLPGQGPGGMMSGPMMQGMMQGMMQTMQGMMGMMQGQMQPGSMQPGRMGPPPAQGEMMMNCPMMMPGTGQADAPAMMRMMQGMMQMMQMMQGQMQPGQMQPDPTQPGQMQPGSR